MRVRAVLLAAALMLAPLGARAADLVVWWEEGFNPEEDQAVREIVAAFEQKTGKTGRARLPRAGRAAGQGPGRARGRAAARLPVRLRSADDYYPAGPTRAGSSTSRMRSARWRPSSTGTRSTTPRCSTRPPAGAASTRCRWAAHQPRPRLEEPARAGRLHARGHPQGVGGRSGPSGATRSSRPCARPLAATTSGASACRCRPRRRHRGSSFCQFWRPTGPTT